MAPGALGLIAGALAPQRPLPLQLFCFPVHLPKGGQCNRDLVRLERLQQDLRHTGIHRQGPHRLTRRSPRLVPIGLADITRVIAVRTGVVHAHAATAPAAHRDPLQERQALAGRSWMTRRGMIGVVGQMALVGHKLLPADVAGMSRLAAHRPLGDGNHGPAGPTGSCSRLAGGLMPASINIRAGIGGIVKDAEHPGAGGLAPDYVLRGRSAGRPHRHRKPVGPQMAHHRMGTVPRAERGEHEGQANTRAKRACTSSSGLRVTAPAGS